MGYFPNKIVVFVHDSTSPGLEEPEVIGIFMKITSDLK